MPIRDVITTDPAKAKAVENELRAKILFMLADEERTVTEVHDELQRRGVEKAETTVRHHVFSVKRKMEYCYGW